MALRDKLDSKRLEIVSLNLSYGENSPYVTVNIDTQKVTSLRSTLPANISNDGTRINSAIIDTARISSFLFEKPWWSARQVGLQLLNIKPNFSYKEGRLTTFPSSLQLYLPSNTLAQVTAQGVGLHFERWGLLPGVGNSYEDLKKWEKDNNNKGPLIEFKNKLIKQPTSNSPYEPIYSYLGGPGVISTIIRRYENSLLSIENNKGNLNTFIQQPWSGSDNKWALGYGDQIYYPSLLGASEKYKEETKSTSNLNTDNFNTTSTSVTITPGYLAPSSLASSSLPIPNPLFNIYDTKIGLYSGSSFNNNKNQFSPKKSEEKITYRNNNQSVTIKLPEGLWEKIDRSKYYEMSKEGISGELPVKAKDIIDFAFKAIDTDLPNDPQAIVTIPFQAYLTDLTDSANAKWEGVQYSGRAETLYTYNGFTRTISFSFKAVAHNSDEMDVLYNKLNYLMSNMTGDYKGLILRGPFMKLTIGNYVNDQPGIIEALTYKVSNDTPWEIGITEIVDGVGTTKSQLPHIIDVNVTFVPIGIYSAGTGLNNFIPRKARDSRFINQNPSVKVIG